MRALAEAAGLSRHQRKQALRVANIPHDVFERLIESDHPPTVTALARLGTRPAPGRDRTKQRRLHCPRCHAVLEHRCAARTGIA
jgi:hypothetical protein